MAFKYCFFVLLVDCLPIGDVRAQPSDSSGKASHIIVAMSIGYDVRASGKQREGFRREDFDLRELNVPLGGERTNFEVGGIGGRISGSHGESPGKD